MDIINQLIEYLNDELKKCSDDLDSSISSMSYVDTITVLSRWSALMSVLYYLKNLMLMTPKSKG